MSEKPILNERTNDDGSHSHWEVIDSEGAILFTEDVENVFMDKHHAKSCYLIPRPSTESAKKMFDARYDIYLNLDGVQRIPKEAIYMIVNLMESFAQAPISDKKFLLKLIDITWNTACEDESVPSTGMATLILKKAGYNLAPTITKEVFYCRDGQFGPCCKIQCIDCVDTQAKGDSEYEFCKCPKPDRSKGGPCCDKCGKVINRA